MGDAPQILVADVAEQVALATTIGARIRLAREWAGLTLGQAARMHGMTTSAMSCVERDTVDASRLVAWAASAYAVSERWLHTGVLRGPTEVVLRTGPPDKLVILVGVL